MKFQLHIIKRVNRTNIKSSELSKQVSINFIAIANDE